METLIEGPHSLPAAFADSAGTGAAEALAGRLIESLVPAIELLTVEFGRQLGLYSVLAEVGASDGMTPRQLAAASGIDRRIAREWLEQQAVAGFVAVPHEHADAEERRFSLPDAQRAVLLQPESAVYAMGAATMFAGTASALDAVIHSARTGRGVRYADFGAGVRHGLRQLNRPGFVGELDMWIAHLPDIASRLEDGGTILDLGCGTGWSAVSLARLFPRASVIGVDLDPVSVQEATALARELGLESRVRFALADATDRGQLEPLLHGPVDLVTVFEALHDMNEPQAALEAAHRVLAPSGAVLVGDERVADAFAPDGDFLERLNYGFSVLHCLPATMAEGPGTANGTVLRAATVREWAAAAGFGRSVTLDIEHPFWRFYRLDGDRASAL
jgi:SAM-dependent methyltransferase